VVTSSEAKGYASIIVALAAIALFSLMIWKMLGLIGAEEPNWSRAVYLLTGVEAIAFAAAGFLFGKEVHRQQAEKAVERADKAEATLDECRKQAQESEKYHYQAQDLARAVISKAKTIATRTKEYTVLEAGTIAKIIDSEFDELLTLVNHIFPEMASEDSIIGEVKFASPYIPLAEALTFLRVGSYDSAIDVFDRIIKQDSKDMDAWYNKGIAHHIIGENGIAIECFDKIIKMEEPSSPLVADAWYQKGKALKSLGRDDEAKKAFTKAGVWEQGYASG